MEDKYVGLERWYTDGSLAEGKVGYGVIEPNVRIEAGLPNQCFVFSAEAKALSEAVKRITNKAVIFSDSASCIEAIESGKSKNNYIQSIEMDAKGKYIGCLYQLWHYQIWEVFQSLWNQAPRNTLRIVKHNVGKLTDRSSKKAQM